MKLYDGGRAPNPRRVRIYLAEKGIDVPKVPVDLAKMEQKSEALRTLNPLQRLPVLVLDDGTALSETIAISRYFESLHPEPNLFGRDALEIAKIEMWNRRLELALYIQYTRWSLTPPPPGPETRKHRSQPSGDGRIGEPADRRLGGSKQAARFRVSGNLRSRACEPPLRGARSLYRRRHHRPRDGRPDEAGKTRGP